MAGALDVLAVGSADLGAAAPALRWQALVDWIGEGIWGATGEDVSDDVVSVGWRWGCCGLPGPEFAPPATMELSLRNLNHRYTPGNAASPLAGRVQPGWEIWLRAAWLYDDFASDGGTAETLDDRRTTSGADNWRVMAHFLNKNVTFSPNPPNGVDTATARRGWGVGRDCLVCIRIGEDRSGAARSRRAGWDGGIGRSRGHSRTGLARVCRDVRLAGWWFSGRGVPLDWVWNRLQPGEGAAELLRPGWPAFRKMQGEAPGQGEEPPPEGGSWWSPPARPDRCALPSGPGYGPSPALPARRRWRRNGKAAGSAFLGHPRESPRGQIHIMTLGRPRVLRNPRSFSPSLPNATSAGRWASRPTWSSRSGSASSPTPWPPLRRLTGWCTTRSSWSLTSPATALMPLSNGARQMR